MDLGRLLEFNEFVIQTHDNPDADAIASGYGLYRYFECNGKKVRLIYGGKHRIQKSNLVLMTEQLEIPIEYVTEMQSEPEMLITVDCQYGERNVQKFSAQHIAIIDHHMARRHKTSEFTEIRENYGSCSTIIWDMLMAQNYSFYDDEKLSTALYYGLFMDTGKLQEIRHPKDKDIRDDLQFKLNESILNLLQNCNLSSEELRIAGKAMSDIDYEGEGHYALAEAQRCDPNILGIISDALIEVDSVTSCIAYCVMDDGVKLSVRSCDRATRADELASYVTHGIGSGGGHMRKSGGFIVMDLLMEEIMKQYGDHPEKSKDLVHFFLKERMEEYFSNQEFIDTASGNVPDLTGEKVYRKKHIPIGYVKATDMYPVGTHVTVRMTEGDIPFVIKEDTYFMIGTECEVYKNDEAYFLEHNDPTQEPYQMKGDYEPMVHTRFVRWISMMKWINRNV